ncbi:fumarylacetoacetate hydrolase family protein [Leucobacter sp. UCMA 4100]|uniref:fumarylacetoacetate hydrolase family protein n=1 Tax=Leucobacter sp. UCMA 4100 TaxID=2810534 RepID=UPI0022EB6B36|nr:fumarylacetoacetate hydrolase family protein [Leucobacter sp. UCMA 4100]MDA3147847.1 fumarylacetoacetate hydrolase family protein [Leucobacter sp. UCMA 4100]
MKLAHIHTGSDDFFELAVVVGERFAPMSALDMPYKDLQQLIEAGPEARTEVERAAAALAPDAWSQVTEAKLAPAVMRPPITLAVGLNYDEHASELSLDNDAGPVLFTLFPNSLAAHDGDVVINPDISVEIDYEAELGVIIGKPARDVTPEEALDYVFGYTAINDITARDIQFREPQWSRCKSFDGFTPVGPFVVTTDEIPDPQTLAITCDVDDLRVQDSTTEFMIRTVAQLISTISEGATLMPGTLISTGSPGGAGRSRKPPLYLKPGMDVTVTIEKIGALTSHIVE